MFALPRTGPLGVNVQLARAVLPLLLCRGFGGCAGFSSTSNVRLSIAAERGTKSVRGFTLLELLIVVGIIGLLLVLMAPAFTSMKVGTDFTGSLYGIQGLLENAR